jgi:hypothetical protein
MWVELSINHKTCVFIYMCIYTCIIYIEGRNSVVGKATRCWKDDPGIESRRGEFFRNRLDRPRGPLNLLYNGYRVCISGTKRQGCGVDHTSSVVKERVELYLYFSSALSWSVLGWNLPLCIFFSVALRPNPGHSLLVFEVSRSHTHTHLWTSDHLVAETSI